MGNRSNREMESILTSFFLIPLLIEVIVPFQFSSHLCVYSVFESYSLSLYLHFQCIYMFSELISIYNSILMFSGRV